MSSLVDEVKTIIEKNGFKDSEEYAKYIEALKCIVAMQDTGLLNANGSSLLPIEERYKSIYISHNTQ